MDLIIYLLFAVVLALSGAWLLLEAVEECQWQRPRAISAVPISKSADGYERLWQALKGFRDE